jgi:hypothetical protein
VTFTAVATGKRLEIEARLPEKPPWQQWRVLTLLTREGVRGAEQKRIAERKPPLLPLRIWIDHRTQAHDETVFHLLLYLWRANMIDIDPAISPDAWEFLKRFLPLRRPAREKLRRAGGGLAKRDLARLKDELLCEFLEVLREKYVAPDTPYGIRTYAKRVALSLRQAEAWEASLLRNEAEALDDDDSTVNERIAKNFADSWRNTGV